MPAERRPNATDRHVLQRVAREVAAYVKHELGEGVGMAIVFDYGPPGEGNLAYASTGDRGDMMTAIRGLLENFDAGLYTDPLGPRPK